LASTLSINASAFSSGGYDSRSYFAEFFAGLAADSMTYFGGTPDSAYGGTYYVNGSQVVARYVEGEDDGAPLADAAVIVDGADLAYDFIHNGAAYGHGISGQIDSLSFGEWVDGTTSGTQGTGAAGRVTGFDTGLHIEGFDLSAPVGSGSDGATNPVYGLYKMVQTLDAEALNDVLTNYAVEMTGSAQRDVLVGFDHDDVLMGGGARDRLLGAAGDDILIGGSGNDVLNGGQGWDVLTGGAGDDTLRGGGGRDVLKGGNGDDVLNGGGGRDRLTGGDGADTFVMTANAGADVITDFDGTEDVIDVTALGLTGLADFTVSDVAAGTLLVAADVSIQLNGVASADLTDDFFVF
jgi:Ca2+-binding RTX toxin-like protein